MSNGHAYLSASSAHRWLACTMAPSVEAQLPDSTSAFAEEGTRAHTMAYECLLASIDTKEWYARKEISIAVGAGSGEESQELLGQLDRDFPLEMRHKVQEFVDYVNDRIAYARRYDPRTEVKLEQKLDFSLWVPEGYGTGDVVIIYAGVCEVIDLKYGKGVAVEAADNPQLMLYGLGAYNELDMLYDIDTVVMTIHQPRLDTVDTHSMAVTALLKWAEEVVRPAAHAAYTGKGAEFVPGDDQCRFCRAKASCRARAVANLSVARDDFADPVLLSDEEIAELLPRVDGIRKWVDAVQDYALKRAERGHRFPGFKLVEGRSNRRITDKRAAIVALKEAGYTDDLILTPDPLLSLTELEKVVGRKVIAETLEGLIDKPAGKPTLVPVTDRRPEIEPRADAAEDFADIDGADENG